MTVYERDQGVVCYAADLLRRDEEIIPQLLSSGFAWHWRSQRTREVHPEFEHLHLPVWGALTELSADTLSAFRLDLQERNVDDYGRHIEAFAVDAGGSLKEGSLHEHLQAFAQERGPIRIAAIQIDDIWETYLFVPHYPPAQVQRLLGEWGICPENVTKRYPYKRLRLARLESLFRL